MTITADNLRRALAAHFDEKMTAEVAATIFVEAHADGDCSIDPARFPIEQYEGYTFQAERARSILAELAPLHEAQWGETERYRSGIPMRPDFEIGLGEERAGRLLQFTIRRDGQLVGHLRLYLATSRHTQTLFSTEDTYYIDPGHRGGFMALQFLKFAERCLMSIDVLESRFDAKLLPSDGSGARGLDAGVLLRRLRYSPVSTRFVKILKGGADVR